jgi:hypothetical protein
LLLICLSLAVAAGLAGCATPAPPGVSAPAAAPDTPAGTPQWWVVHVRMGWRGEAQVEWHLDALLAEQVFAPVIERLGPALVLWRFHRRAAPDATGHRLRFLFYADPAVAAQVLAAVRASALLADLVATGHVAEVELPDAPEGTAIEATSDPAWPPPVQRAWPYFAMGVSRNWLALVDDVSGQLDPPPAGDVEAMVAHYRAVNAQVDALWQVNAQHAWLHHLNALFGYQPVLLRERRLMRF